MARSTILSYLGSSFSNLLIFERWTEGRETIRSAISPQASHAIGALDSKTLRSAELVWPHVLHLYSYIGTIFTPRAWLPGR